MKHLWKAAVREVKPVAVSALDQVFHSSPSCAAIGTAHLVR